MLDGLEEDLLEICKNLEKSLIQNFIAAIVMQRQKIVSKC